CGNARACIDSNSLILQEFTSDAERGAVSTRPPFRRFGSRWHGLTSDPRRASIQIARECAKSPCENVATSSPGPVATQFLPRTCQGTGGELPDHRDATWAGARPVRGAYRLRARDRNSQGVRCTPVHYFGLAALTRIRSP